MDSSLFYIFSGLTLGAAAGLMPGPLLALMVSETVKHGKREGFRIAVAPLLTDPPILIVAYLVAAAMSNLRLFNGIISLAGAVYLCYLGIESFALGEGSVNRGVGKPRSLRRGMLTNLLNPHPYVFWLTVGAPTVLKAFGVSVPAAAGFVAAFYAGIVGSKMGIALAVDRARGFMGGRGYFIALKILGAVLVVFAAILFAEGVRDLRGSAPAAAPREAACLFDSNGVPGRIDHGRGNGHDPA
jgi:threonine/homoserine/homoserine lactone efflux protein